MAATMIVTTLAAGADARRRLVSALARGTELNGVFFFSDAVEAAATPDEREAWRALAERHRVTLWLCSASAERRGHDVTGDPPPGFAFAGIDRFAELAVQAERIEVAGRR